MVCPESLSAAIVAQRPALLKSLVRAMPSAKTALIFRPPKLLGGAASVSRGMETKATSDSFGRICATIIVSVKYGPSWPGPPMPKSKMLIWPLFSPLSATPPAGRREERQKRKIGVWWFDVYFLRRAPGGGFFYKPQKKKKPLRLKL